MKKMLIAAIAAGLIGGAALTADDALAGNGRGGGGCCKGTAICTRVSSAQQTAIRQRLRDGSCLNSTAQVKTNQAKKGNTYGPGDGTGNDGTRPKDGTGYGSKGSK